MDKKTRRLVIVWLGMTAVWIVIFYGFSVWVKHGGMQQADFNLTVKAEDKIADRWDGPLSVLSLIGSFEITTLVLTAILVIRKKWQGVLVFGTYTVGSIVEVFGKSFLPHPSPPFMFYRYHIDIVFPSSYVHTNFSYPSGHAYRSTFIILYVIWLIWSNKKLDKRYRIILGSGLAVLLVTMLFSRVSLGEHWTSDVIGGVLAGLAMACAAIGVSLATEKIKLQLSEVKPKNLKKE